MYCHHKRFLTNSIIVFFFFFLFFFCIKVIVFLFPICLMAAYLSSEHTLWYIVVQYWNDAVKFLNTTTDRPRLDNWENDNSKFWIEKLVSIYFSLEQDSNLILTVAFVCNTCVVPWKKKSLFRRDEQTARTGRLIGISEAWYMPDIKDSDKSSNPCGLFICQISKIPLSLPGRAVWLFARPQWLR